MPTKHARGVKLVLKFGDGDEDETFTVKCSINAARGISFASTTNDFSLPNCEDPDEIAWLAREKESLSVAVTGAGILSTNDVQEFFTWWKSPDTKNCQVIVDVPSADGGVIFEGAYHLTDFDITGDKGAKMECSITLASDGEVTCVANT